MQLLCLNGEADCKATLHANRSGGVARVASRSYLLFMRSVGLKVLKNRLSEYVRIAASGETVLVTDRERVVAELSAPRDGRPERVADALLADEVEKGWITPAKNHARAAPPRYPVATLAELLGELDADRADR